MLQNYFKVAFRNLLRYKGFSFINISGLTLGLTACLLIALFVRDELQFDKFIPEGERIFRIYNQDGGEQHPTTPPMFGTTLDEEFPEVEEVVRVLKINSKDLFEVGSKKMYEEGGIAADPTFFDIFPLSFKYGSPVKSLNEPTSIVLSEEMAERYFGNSNPVGEEIIFEKTPLLVTGVFQNNPKFHLNINYIVRVAIVGIPDERMKSWHWQQFNNYVKLKSGIDVDAFESKFQKVVTEKTRPIMRDGDHPYHPKFQPLHKIHLYSANFKNEWLAVRGNITYVRALGIIAIFILLIACFNFINLATARSLQRAKEVGVRKTIGGSRKQLMIQFLGETMLLTFISTVLSVCLTFLLLPWLNQFTEKHITFDLFTNPVILVSLFLLALLVGVFAGFYPAMFLSGFKPVRVLKGGVSNDSPDKIQWLREGLVVVQFSLTVLLIISALVVYKQVSYLHNKDLGLNKEQIMFFPMRGDKMFANHETFKNQLLQSPGVSSVSIGYGFPGDMVAGDQITVPAQGEQKTYNATHLMVDYDYIKTLKLKLVAGRDFSKETVTDKDEAFIINETGVKELGFKTPENAVGKKLQWEVDDSLKRGYIIGVVKDFNYKSLYDKIGITVLHIFPRDYWKVAVKLEGQDFENSIAQIKKVWKSFSPDYPIEYRFLDESFEQMYKAEDKLKTLLLIFTAIAIFVGCLGLFGLAAYAIERRTKEVGVRKVLGADTSTIVALLSKDFLKLAAIAAFIAFPIAWFLMVKWLQDFAYRIEIPVWIFFVSGFMAILVAFLTVIYHALKAATTNPIKHLRTE